MSNTRRVAVLCLEIALSLTQGRISPAMAAAIARPPGQLLRNTPCLSILSSARELMYTVSAVSITGTSAVMPPPMPPSCDISCLWRRSIFDRCLPIGAAPLDVCTLQKTTQKFVVAKCANARHARRRSQRLTTGAIMDETQFKRRDGEVISLTSLRDREVCVTKFARIFELRRIQGSCLGSPCQVPMVHSRCQRAQLHRGHMT